MRDIQIWAGGLHLQAECFVGTHVARMAVNPEELMQVGTGGKENDLKLWDGNRLDAGPTFQAKNVRSLSTILHTLFTGSLHAQMDE